MTDGGDLYCCGGHPAQIPIIEGLDNIPNLVDIRGKGVVDFGIGSLHMIVLTDDGRVMVIGNNTNGQLGIAAEKATTWTEVPLGLGEDSTVIAVRAGPRTSFVIIEGDRQVEDLSESAEEDGAP
jgi:alpha-tubulin suppressor-like RCC1 family protein